MLYNNKRNKLQLSTTWMHFKSIMLTKISQTQDTTCHITPLVGSSRIVQELIKLT